MSLLLALGLALSLPHTTSDDWKGWRGPHGDGTSADTPPLEWSEEKNVAWRAELCGSGLSSPIVADGRVFVTTAVATGAKRPGTVSDRFPRPFELEEQSLLVLAFDRASGAELWRREVSRAFPHEPTHPTNSYATPTPVCDGTRVYCSFGSLGLYALNLDGTLAWQKDLGDLVNNGHGEGSSPLLHGDGLFVLWAHWGASFLIRLDPATGAERWRVPVPEGNNCSTPLVVHVGDEEQLVVAGRRTQAFDPATGRELWAFGQETADGVTSMASPVATEELVVVPSVNRRDLRALVAGSGGEPAEELWSRRATDNIPSPLIHHGRVLYLRGDSAQLTAIDCATGEATYGPERLDGVSEVWASPIVAADRLYVTDREGVTAVLALEPDPRPLARNVLDDHFDASPAVAGDALFLRGRKHLYCVREARDR